jgi:hypothetical protein
MALAHTLIVIAFHLELGHRKTTYPTFKRKFAGYLLLIEATTLPNTSFSKVMTKTMCHMVALS